MYLPYIIMAYRSTVHESTAFSPNILMLGREAMYEMPSEMKDILDSISVGLDIMQTSGESTCSSKSKHACKKSIIKYGGDSETV